MIVYHSKKTIKIIDFESKNIDIYAISIDLSVGVSVFLKIILELILI